MTVRRAIVWLLVVAGLIGIATSQVARVTWELVALAFDRSGPSGCEPREIKSEVSSPDGAWIATAYSDVCIAGPWTTVYSDSVEIRRPQDPPPRLPGNSVFGKQHDVNDPPLAVTWIAPRILEIKLPNLSSIGKQQAEFADVAIVYRYVPDDPVDRICSKRWSAVMSDIRMLDRPRPDRDAFFAACRGAPSEQLR